jgi:PilZ domain
VALRLELAARQEPRAVAFERRKHVRLPIALPIFVRQVGMPWPEESMTQNISRSGLLFESSQVYEPGEEVLGKIPWGEWADAGEISGRVLRFESRESQPGDASLSNAGLGDENPILARVAIQWTFGQNPALRILNSFV